MPLTRRRFLAGAAGGPLLQTGGRRARKTNVVFFLTDDHGAWAVGPWGCPEIHTPNLAALGAGGTRFDRAYASTPVCSPSRLTYLTGRLPSTHGVCDALGLPDLVGPKRHRFLEGQPTYTELLAKAGYTVGLSGKWHMGDDENAHAGFSYWCTIPGGGSTYRDPEFIKNGRRVKTKGFKTDRVGDFALEFLRANKDRPFFLYMPFFAPHTPFNYQPEEYRAPYKDSPFSCFPEVARHPQRRWGFERFHNRESKVAYSALITGMDHNVGRILRYLDEAGLRENTLVVFSADQGWNAGHHGVWGKGNATIPFNMYEESIRVPLIWSHPGRIPAGKVVSPLVSSYDFFPTILDYLGVDAPPPDARRIGRSYAPFLRGQAPEWRTELYFEYCYVRAIRTRNMKYVERADEWGSELFDLEADAGESVNVIGDRSRAKQLAELRTRMRGVFRATGAPPLDEWRTTTRQTILVDSAYYRGWSERPPGAAGRKAPE